MVDKAPIRAFLPWLSVERDGGRAVADRGVYVL